MKHRVSPIVPTPIDDERFSRNGKVPDVALFSRVSNTFNFIACAQKKQVFLRTQLLDAAASGASAADIIWPNYFHTGEATSALRIHAGIALTSYGYTMSSPPELGIVIKNSSGTTVVSKFWKQTGRSAGGTVVASEIHHLVDVIEGLSANTSYFHEIQITNGMRLVYLSITEESSKYADDSLTGICDPSVYVAEAPIYDAHVAELVTTNNALWRHNGAHLLSWCGDYDEDGAPLTSAFTAPTSYTNVIDGGTATSVTTGTSGFRLFTQYHTTYNRSTYVPAKLAVKAARTSGAGTLDVRLTDGTNSVAITGISGTVSPQGWSTGTVNMPVQAGTKWDIQAKVSAGGTVYRIQAVSLFEYEA